MPLRFYRPMTAGRRNASVIDFRKELTKGYPEKTLLERLPQTGGRNAHGRITNPAMQSSYTKLYRKIDYRRSKDGKDPRAKEGEFVLIDDMVSHAATIMNAAMRLNDVGLDKTIAMRGPMPSVTP